MTGTPTAEEIKQLEKLLKELRGQKGGNLDCDIKLQKWKQGMRGLIYLPEKGTAPGEKKPRPYAIYEINEEGQLTFREGLMTWTEANSRIKIMARNEQCLAFSCPEGDDYHNFMKIINHK